MNGLVDGTAAKWCSVDCWLNGPITPGPVEPEAWYSDQCGGGVLAWPATAPAPGPRSIWHPALSRLLRVHRNSSWISSDVAVSQACCDRLFRNNEIILCSVSSARI